MRTFASIDEALSEIAAGRMVVVLDEAGRENEGDLIMAAERVTPEAVNFMAAHGRGLICTALEATRLEELEIPMMVASNTAIFGTAFGVSVDCNLPGHSGISVTDRAVTIRALCDPATTPSNLARPGHVFPLRSEPGGVLRRPGHTEAATDLARLAGLRPAGVLCEILGEDGSVARLPELKAFAERYELKMITIEQLIRWRRRDEAEVRRIAEAALPTVYGEFRAIGYESAGDGRECVALVMGDITTPDDVLVRVHSQCLTGDMFGSLRCDCGPQLDIALGRIADEGRGVLVYIPSHEGRGIGLLNKLRAYSLQDLGLDTVEANEALGFPADQRDYGVSASILEDLKVGSVRLMTNNPAKRAGLESHGVRIVERVPVEVAPNVANRRYLMTKQSKLGHWLGDGQAV